MPTLRPKRESKSRTSTPLPPTAKNSPASITEPRKEKAEKTQSLLDGWVEPPVKAPVPSFEDYGLARHGVLENMAPLGVPPSSKIKAKLRLSENGGIKRLNVGRNGNGLAGDEATSTPETTPAPELARDDSDRQDEDVLQTMQNTQDEDEDDEYVPKGAKASVRAVKTPVKNGVAKITTPLRDSVLLATPATDSNTVAAKQRLQIAVYEALRRANEEKNSSVGFALRKMHEESSSNPRIAECLNNIMHQKPTARDQMLFRHLVKSHKKQLKKTQKPASVREASQSGESAAKPANSFTPININPSPSRREVTTAQSENTRSSFNPSGITKLKLNFSSHARSEASTNPANSAPDLPVTTASPKQSEIAVRSPKKRKLANPAASIEISTSVQPSSAMQSPLDGTDSDLSDVNEEIVQNGPPEPLAANSDTSEPLKKMRGRKKSMRGGKKSRAGSLRPGQVNGHGANGDQEDVHSKRQEMLERTIRSEDPFPLSSMRFEDDASSLPDTDSVTSQLTPSAGPDAQQADSIRLRRNARPSRNEAQRPTPARKGRPSSKVATPQVESAAPSRPSTPAFLPPTKKVKLNNGQAARTKKSPVKNRPGPVAGIPHVGGGGLRPLGPDDNDAASPQGTDNDDFCSACHGAGVFLCCDGCPRSFHFVCCDPPLHEDQVPDEAYYCHHCRSRLKAGNEESSVETFTPLGALFKQLEATNAKAFVLPEEIQNYFEDVSARPDGSYCDTTKRFPLSKSSGYGAQRPDYLKQTAQNKAVLCIQCGESSRNKRQMLQCDFCHDYWHLDCCVPPLANPPYIGPDATHRDAWRCPRHIEHDYRSGQVIQRDLNLHDDDTDIEDAAPLPRKVRKPREPVVYEPAFSRGTRNNGLVEVINEPDIETDGEGNYLFSPLAREELDENSDQNGKVFRLPEKGIILDFISKVKDARTQEQRARRSEERAARKLQKAEERRARKAKAALEARSLKTQQAALHLTQMANKDAEVGLNETTIEALILGLTAEAPSEVIGAVSAAANPPPLTEAKREELRRLKDLIERALKSESESKSEER